MKRSYSDEDNNAESQSRPARTNGFNPKRQKQFGTGKHRAKEGSLEFSKKRARNIERLLQRRKDLPANVQNDLQRELDSRKSTVSDKSFQKKRSAMISKYHMVRFFGRFGSNYWPVCCRCAHEYLADIIGLKNEKKPPD
jgi:hypothetical protein